jgi:lysylphosphatidylglycerol synthetase-like protein (DUF2156 family)
MAYSTLQPGLEYFVHEQLGYLAYMPLWHPLLAPRGLRVVIGNPICQASDYEALLDAYLERPGAAATVFLEIDSRFAEVLSRRGYPVNEMGVEWELDLGTFDSELRGSRYSQLRHWRNKARKEGVQVVEGRLSELDGEELMSLNQDWLQRKGGHELVGLNRPLTLEDEEDVRYFWATRDGQLLSLAIFDPMYRDGRIIGYLHNLSRTVQDAPHGTADLIVLEALKTFQAEGLEVLSLGLSPLAQVREASYRHNRSVKALFGWMFRHASRVYPFEGNFFHKEKYRGRGFKVYLSSIPDLSLYRVLGVFKALQVL